MSAYCEGTTAVCRWASRRLNWPRPYRGRSDRVADFHALRHTFITRLARTGAWPATAMKMARHRSIAMTMEYYTYILITDERTALSKLPPIRMSAKRSKLKATGTDDFSP